jgi:hypothetical protein
MRLQASLVLLAIVMALGLGHGVAFAQPECTNIYLKLVVTGDPACNEGYTVTTGWSIYVTSSPSSTSAGSCSSFTLDNLYAGVVFFNGGCGEFHRFECNIVATGSILSGYYILTDLGGGCFKVCQTCTP